MLQPNSKTLSKNVPVFAYFCIPVAPAGGEEDRFTDGDYPPAISRVIVGIS